MNIRASYTFDVATMSRGRYWHWKANPSWLVLSGIGVLAIVFGIYLQVHLARPPASSIALIIAGLYLALRYWFWTFAFRRAIRKHPQFNTVLRWAFSEDGVKLTSAHAELKASWDLYVKTYTAPDGFLLYPQKGIFNWIPRSSFESGEQAMLLRDILTRKTRNTDLIKSAD